MAANPAGIPPQYTGYPSNSTPNGQSINLTTETGVEGGQTTGDF